MMDVSIWVFPKEVTAMEGIQAYESNEPINLISLNLSPSISITTDKESYTVGERAFISGTVSSITPGKENVRLDVYDAQGAVVSDFHQAHLNGNEFEYTIGTAQMPPGIYKITATYGQQTGQIELKVLQFS